MDAIKYIILLTAAMAGFVLLIVGSVLNSGIIVDAGAIMLWGGLLSCASILTSHGIHISARIFSVVACWYVLIVGIALYQESWYPPLYGERYNVSMFVSAMIVISPAIYMIYRDYIRRPKDGS